MGSSPVSKTPPRNPAGTAALLAEAPAGFEIYSGNDGDTLPLLAIGAVGTISVESHWAGEELAEMMAAFAKGDVEHARHLIPAWCRRTAFSRPTRPPTRSRRKPC